MQQPGLPENEADRVATLHSLNILDTARDERFDRFTRISARIFDMPIAVISLVDRYRQWFKAAEGLATEETPRDVSFCGHAILGDDVFEVRNARRDSRFRDNPLVVGEPNICFYAGAPLATPNGHKLGTLCIIDKVPRRLSDDEKTMLKHLADMVVGEMINYVDTDTGLANRNALTVAGAKFFKKPAAERSFDLLLFEIRDGKSTQCTKHSQPSLGEQFARILHEQFPAAESIAHMGSDYYCVLLKGDEDFDAEFAARRVCTTAKNSLTSDGGHQAVAALVAHLKYESGKYSSIDDLIREVDELFFQHTLQPFSDIGGVSSLKVAVNSLRRRLKRKGRA
ncbi:MAG: GAF domain-containing protein [Gammaproteobacteria bacterium]|nr:GAF domain-containing protein [Gammaproteobacteria bacterium]